MANEIKNKLVDVHLLILIKRFYDVTLSLREFPLLSIVTFFAVMLLFDALGFKSALYHSIADEVALAVDGFACLCFSNSIKNVISGIGA